MEGFVHPTKAQKLAAVAQTLKSAYPRGGSSSEKLFEDQLRRLDEAERASRPSSSK
jgi:hypothetical protein